MKKLNNFNKRNKSISEDLIRDRAYDIWQKRGGGDGNAETDWTAAIESLNKKSVSSKILDNIKISDKWIIGLTILSISINIWQYFDKKTFDQLQRQSNLTTMIGAVGEGSTRFNKVDVREDTILFRQKYRCILTNNGYTPTSIVSWHMYALEENPATGKLGGAWYAGMEPKLLDNIKNETETQLPIQFQPGESKVVYIEVGMIVPKTAWQATKSLIPINKLLSYKKANTIFVNAGYPMFGQAKSIPIAPKITKIQTYAPDNEYQEFVVYFTKGNGWQTSAQFSLMSNELYIQDKDEEIK